MAVPDAAVWSSARRLWRRTGIRRADRLWGLGRDRPVELGSPADVLTNGNLLVASSVLVRRSAALEVGAFSEDMARGADLDLWLRVLEHGPGIVSPR